MLAIAKRFTAAVMLVVFTLGNVTVGQAQGLTLLPAGERVSLSTAYAPCLMKGVRYYPDDPFRFDFIVEPGDSGFTDDRLKEESSRLIKQFLASLTTPAFDLWVNLSPYESGKIIPDAFGLTEMGRDLLAQDYVLKQMTASLMDPDSAMGKEFWRKVYARAMEDLGDTDIPVDTFHKIWIVPSTADIVVKNNTAVVVNSHLKVMLERDYYAQQTADFEQVSIDEEEAVITDTMRAVLLPEVEREINEGKNFAPLRQIYNSLVLAVWMKRKVKSAVVDAYADRNKIAGVEHGEPGVAGKVWERYAEAFRAGVAHIVREERDLYSGEIIPRKYFSGGVDWAEISSVQEEVPFDSVQVASVVTEQAMVVTASLKPQQFGQNYNAVQNVAKSNLGIELTQEQGSKPILKVQGVPAIMIGQGAFNYVFSTGEKVYRVSKRLRSEHTGEGDSEFLRTVKSFKIAQEARMGPNLIEYGLTADGQRYYMIVDLLKGETLDALSSKSRFDLMGENKSTILNFVRRFFTNGVYLLDFKASNFLLTSDENGNLEIQIVDAELMKYSYENPMDLKQQLKERLQAHRNSWSAVIFDSFLKAIDDVSLESAENVASTKDYWGHAAREESQRNSSRDIKDQAQMSLSDQEVANLGERKSAGLILVKEPGVLLLKNQGENLDNVDTSGGLNYIFFGESRVFRVSKDLRKENDANSDREFLYKIHSFQIAEKEGLGPKVYNYGLTADGKRYYIEVERWRGFSLDALDGEQEKVILANDGAIIKKFVNLLFEKGLYLLDFTSGNLFLFTREDGEKEIRIVDPEFVKYSDGTLKTLKREFDVRLDRARDEWEPGLMKRFQRAIEEVYVTFSAEDLAKRNFWENRAAQRFQVDPVQTSAERPQRDQLGGIDLDEKNLAIAETGDGTLQPVIGAVALAQLGEAFTGFIPVILAIKPLGDMSTFAGK